MNKRDKIMMYVMIFLSIMNIIMHFVAYDNLGIGAHLNYIATVLVAFTLGVYVAKTPRFRS